jgi:DMSO/TMAO reductase YedYZ molybdopterin-dependent catalytic subunit
MLNKKNWWMMKTMLRRLGLYLLLVLLYGCHQSADQPSVPFQSTPSSVSAHTKVPIKQETTFPSIASTKAEQRPDTATPTATAREPDMNTTPGACQLVEVTQPPWPAQTLSPNEFDPETGLHMTGRPQQIDLAAYRLKVSGLVNHPLSLTYDELRCMPKVTDNPELICLGVFIDYATWSGVPINYILELAGVQPEATQLNLVSADGFKVHIPLETARQEENFLAYEVDGKTLPVQHGFPLRAVFPSMGGAYWLKWLVEIQIS